MMFFYWQNNFDFVTKDQGATIIFNQAQTRCPAKW